ncbi:MAG: hypothetical protein ACRDI0_03895 [Actinomycetota bacterium]
MASGRVRAVTGIEPGEGTQAVRMMTDRVLVRRPRRKGTAAPRAAC